MYCVKYRKNTETNNIERVLTKNNQKILKGVCAICGRTKSSFAPNKHSVAKTGGGLNDFINNLPIELHQLRRKEKMFPVVLLMSNTNIRIAAQELDTINR